MKIVYAFYALRNAIVAATAITAICWFTELQAKHLRLLWATTFTPSFAAALFMPQRKSEAKYRVEMRYAEALRQIEQEYARDPDGQSGLVAVSEIRKELETL